MIAICLYFLVSASYGGQLLSSNVYTGSDRAGILALHNDARKEAEELYGARYGYEYKEMLWNDALAQEAKTWAETLGRGVCRAEHDPAIVANARGENIGYANWQWAVGQMIDPEKAYYSWSKYQAYLPDGRPIGHYGTIIRTATRQVGCAKSTCKGTSSWGVVDSQATTLVVCRYYHPPYSAYPNYDPSSDWPNRSECLEGACPDSSSSSSSSSGSSSGSSSSTGSTWGSSGWGSGSGNTIWLGSSGSSWGSSSWTSRSSSAPIGPLPKFVLAALAMNVIILFALCAYKCRVNRKQKALQMEMEMEFGPSQTV